MNFKNKLLMLMALTSATSSIIPHGGGWGGGGAFLGGAMLGTGITLAATSGRRYRDPAYDDYKERQYQRNEINREIRGHQKEISHHKNELRRLDKNKSLDDDTRKSRRSEHESAIRELEDLIEDLRRDLRRLF